MIDFVPVLELARESLVLVSNLVDPVVQAAAGVAVSRTRRGAGCWMASHRRLGLAVCSPQSRNCNSWWCRFGVVYAGVCAAARITPHCAGAAAWRRG